MLNVIIFSKDRSCQLDLTLSTLKKYFKEWAGQTYTIIYKFSNQFYKQGYDLVKQYHLESCFRWVVETNFCQNTRDAFNNTTEQFISFLVDDDVFIDEFSLHDREVQDFINNPNILCISPRMAPYINYCYTQNAPQPQPQFNSDRTWEWSKGMHDWGYPMSIASFHIFRKNDLSKAMNTVYFPSPNHLEGTCLDANRPNKPLMICYENAKAICSTINRVQTVNGNKSDNTHSLADLNLIFLTGKRLSPDANHQLKLNMAHGPVKIEWK
jgi:hypothetical protein